jgi:uncharacterized membrane protein
MKHNLYSLNVKIQVSKHKSSKIKFMFPNINFYHSLFGVSFQICGIIWGLSSINETCSIITLKFVVSLKGVDFSVQC